MATTKKMPPKDPSARLDYLVKLDAELGTDTLTTAVFTVSDSSIHIDDQLHDAKNATVWLTLGTDGVLYKVTLTYSTASGRHDVRSFFVPVKVRA